MTLQFIRVAMVTALGAFLAIPVGAQWFVVGADRGEAPVMLTGTYRLLGQTASRQGTFQDRPADIWRAELTPTLSLYGIPLTANVLMSSEQAGIRQDINAFSLTLDPAALQRLVMQRAYGAMADFIQTEDAELLRNLDGIRDSLAVANPERLKQLEAWRTIQDVRDLGSMDASATNKALETLGLMSGAESFIASLPTIGVGTVFPMFSPLTVSGVRVQGASVEWNPGGTIFLQGAYGTTQRPLSRVDTVRLDTTMFTTQDNSAFGRKLYAAKVGVGRREGPHLHVSAMLVADDVASNPGVPRDSTTALTPQKNWVAALDFKVEPIARMWTIQAELAGSATVGDRLAPELNTNQVPDELLSLVDYSASSYADWAFIGSTAFTIRETGTRLTGSYRRLGPGFRTLGVPNLRTDLLRYDVRFDQSFWNRQISAGVFYRRDLDNLIPWKRSTTSITSLGVNLGLSIRRLPFLRLSYAPYVQENDAANPLLQFVNRTTNVMLATGHSYRIDDMQMSTVVNGARQWSETKDNLFDFGVTTVNVSHSVQFPSSLTLQAGLGIIHQTQTAAPDNDIITVDGSAGYTFFDAATCSAGLSIAIEQDRSNRTGYFVSVFVPIEDIANIDIRAERTLFTERVEPAILGGSYGETLFRATISHSW